MAKGFNKTRDAKKPRYGVLQKWIVIVTAVVALTPLFILTFMNYFQYQHALKEEVKERLRYVTTSTKRSLEFFVSERRGALAFISREMTPAELSDPEELGHVFRNLQDVFGGVVDLGFIEPGGRQVAYVGPYDLVGKDYSTQDWFHEVTIRGFHVSDVFLGYRNFPHFVIAVDKKVEGGKVFVLRATIDSEILLDQLRSLHLSPPSQAFIVNQEGVLQTPSRGHGRLLEKGNVRVPPYAEPWIMQERRDKNGDTYLLGCAYISNTPFVLMVIKHPITAMKNWFALRRNLWLLLFFSSSVILLLIVGVSHIMVSRIREADAQRAAVLHNVEYQNKMASLGRLAAGVAHEINNPLAIINEKAGMLMDILRLSDDFPRKEKTEKLAESIVDSVQRCSRITRRLLGFAKHLDIRVETIEMEQLLKEVLGFLEHEARYHDIKIELDVPEENLPPIESDRGQLQQAFLNILNNSLSALTESGNKAGRIRICLDREDAQHVSVAIDDNGPGIRSDILPHIFEPFVTGRSAGTGLGLSITHGIVDKLGGRIEVQSEEGMGARFKITLPLKQS